MDLAQWFQVKNAFYTRQSCVKQLSRIFAFSLSRIFDRNLDRKGKLDSRKIDHFRSLTITSYSVFFSGWLLLMICSLGYCIIVFLSVMYFLGMCFYVSAMVDDLAIALDALDKSLRDHSMGYAARVSIQEGLAREIRFHSEIIEYSKTISEFFYFARLN